MQNRQSRERPDPTNDVGGRETEPIVGKRSHFFLPSGFLRNECQNVRYDRGKSEEGRAVVGRAAKGCMLHIHVRRRRARVFMTRGRGREGRKCAVNTPISN